jgi:hypothetical protein
MACSFGVDSAHSGSVRRGAGPHLGPVDGLADALSQWSWATPCKTSRRQAYAIYKHQAAVRQTPDPDDPQ